MVEYKEKTQKASEEAEFKKGSNCSSSLDSDGKLSNMTYIKINEEVSSKFTAQVKIKINHNTTLEQYGDIIKEAKQQCMVRTVSKRLSNIAGEEDKPWFCEKIKIEINLRKKYNMEIAMNLINVKEKCDDSLRNLAPGEQG